MTPMNHVFQDSCFCVVPSQLTLGVVNNHFNQLNIMEVILRSFWDQPLLGLGLSIFSYLELSLLARSFWNPTTILWSSPSSPVERPKWKKTKSPTNSLGWVPIESPNDSNHPSSPADTPGNCSNNLENCGGMDYCFWASKFWGVFLGSNTSLKCQDSLISAALCSVFFLLKNSQWDHRVWVKEAETLRLYPQATEWGSRSLEQGLLAGKRLKNKGWK